MLSDQIRKILSHYQDLPLRMISTAILAAIFLSGIWRGGLPFLILCSILVALLIYELLLMVGRSLPHWHQAMIALSSGAAFGLIVNALLYAYHFGIAVFLVLSAVTAFALPISRKLFAIFAATIFLATYQLYLVRHFEGFDLALAVVLTVVATDVSGYLFGRLLKGPRLPISYSPMKTWSGTIAGWLMAMCVWSVATGRITAIDLLFALVIALASQVGDLGQSWLKRQVHVKDSSRLLPGHGGMYDRFDSLVGAGIFLMLYQLLLLGAPTG